jgi:hypothetical protein
MFNGPVPPDLILPETCINGCVWLRICDARLSDFVFKLSLTFLRDQVLMRFIKRLPILFFYFHQSSVADPDLFGSVSFPKFSLRKLIRMRPLTVEYRTGDIPTVTRYVHTYCMRYLPSIATPIRLSFTYEVQLLLWGTVTSS